MRALLAGLLIACLGGAATVAAPEGVLVATPRFVPAAGPVLAGLNRVAWVTRRDDAVLDLWVSERGGGPRRVQRFSGADGERLRAPRLTASAEAVGLALRVTDLRGEPLRTLTYAGAFGEPLRPGEPLPVALGRGDQAVGVARGCEHAEIRTVSLPMPARPATGEPRCELRLRSPLRLDGDRLSLGISCAGFHIHCSAAVSVRAAGRVIARGTAHYNHTTPPYAAASLRLAPRARRLVRRGMRVRVTARIGDGTRTGAVTRQTLVQLPAARR